MKRQSVERWIVAAAVAVTLASPATALAGQAFALEEQTAQRNREREERQREQERERTAQQRERTEQERERAEQTRERYEQLYEQGQDAVEDAQWTQAVERFTALVSAKAPRADAALYWRAYSLDKLNRQAEALTSVAELLKGFPSSRWLADARALEIQVRQRAGQPVSPEVQADEELKLFAIQGLQHPAARETVARHELTPPEGTRLVRAGAEQLPSSTPGPHQHRAWWFQPGPPDESRSVPRHTWVHRQSPATRRDLRRVDRR